MASIYLKKSIIKEKLDHYVCDICKKETSISDNEPVSQHHNEWGNDCCESYKTYDTCSPKCFLEAVKRTLKEIGGRKSGEINNLNVKYWKELILNEK